MLDELYHRTRPLRYVPDTSRIPGLWACFALRDRSSGTAVHCDNATVVSVSPHRRSPLAARYPSAAACGISTFGVVLLIGRMAITPCQQVHHTGHSFSALPGVEVVTRGGPAGSGTATAPRPLRAPQTRLLDRTFSCSPAWNRTPRSGAGPVKRSQDEALSIDRRPIQRANPELLSIVPLRISEPQFDH